MDVSVSSVYKYMKILTNEEYPGMASFSDRKKALYKLLRKGPKSITQDEVKQSRNFIEPRANQPRR